MSDRSGIFSGENPFDLTRAWMAEAAMTEPNDPDAMALATVDAQGLPNVRMVLLKQVEENGFLFYTNYESAKGTELDGAGKAAFVIHWKTLRRQIRARGTVEKVDPAQSDAYYMTRPLDSRIGAWGSRQSRVLGSRAELEAEIADVRTRFGENPPRPPHWGGYRLRPLEMEFWADGPFRLHDRFHWKRDGLKEVWQVSRLNP